MRLLFGNVRRRLGRDNTLAMDGVDWESDLHFLAGLWLPPSKHGVLDELTDVVPARQSAVLTGEPGAGRTWDRT